MPLIDIRAALSLPITPQEAEQRPILREEMHLMKHAANVSADGHSVLPEPQQHTEH